MYVYVWVFSVNHRIVYLYVWFVSMCLCCIRSNNVMLLLLLLLLLVVVVFNGFGITVNDGDYTTTGSPECVDHIKQHFTNRFNYDALKVVQTGSFNLM